MNIDELTIGQVRELQSMIAPKQPTSHPYKIGENYLIRTVTMIDTGRLVAVTDGELVLEEACWIADTGRWMQALRSCEFSEVEPFPEGEVIINRGSVIDAVKIPSLPRSQK